MKKLSTKPFNRKRHFTGFLFLIAVCGLLVVSLYACSESNPKQQKENPEATETIQPTVIRRGANRELRFEKFNREYKYKYKNKDISITMSVDFPVEGSGAVFDSLSHFVHNFLGGECDYTISVNEHLDSYCEYYKHVLENLADDCSDGYANSSNCWQSVEFVIEHIFENAEFVTYRAICCYTIGTAMHEDTHFETYSFFKKNGSRFGYDMFKSSEFTNLRNLLVRAIIEQYGENYYYNSILDHIKWHGQDKLPFPEHTPYIDENGVNFKYDTYEVTCRADGAPGVSIPFEKIKPLLKNY